MTYTVYQRPYKLRSKNRQEFINEVILDLVLVQMPIFSDWGPSNPEVQYQLGFVFISPIVLCIVFNMGVIMYDLLRTVYLVWTKYFKRVKKRLNAWNALEQQPVRQQET